jgi:hypothetical protein
MKKIEPERRRSHGTPVLRSRKPMRILIAAISPRVTGLRVDPHYSLVK